MTEPRLIPDDAPGDAGGRPRRALTIGAVCDLLRADFPSISISKIRYLEDQKLVAPQRTPGGYRLYSPLEVERLRTILRLQRDEFLPLRVIRQELESSTTGAFSVANQAKQLKRAQLAEPAPTRRYAPEEIIPTTGADVGLVRALKEFQLIGGARRRVRRHRPGGRADRPGAGLVRRGASAPADLPFAADREADLLEQLLSVGMRSRNPDRRREALEALESLAALAAHMRHLMLISALRQIVSA